MQEEFRERGASQFLPEAGLASDTLDWKQGKKPNGILWKHANPWEMR